MKKLLFIVMLAVLSGLCVSAALPKQAKQAEKLVGNFAQLGKARSLISEVLNDSNIKPNANIYFIAGRIEREAYRHFYRLLSINSKDPSVDLTAMADALMDAHSYFQKSIALDSVYDKNGKLKVKYSHDIAQWVSTSASAIYNAGIAYLNKKLYYPKAYNAFITYASLPDLSYFAPEVAITDSLRANAYFYGGVMAYNARKFNEAIDAFIKARKYGYTKKEVYLNEISALSHIAKNTSHADSLALLSAQITDVAAEGLTNHDVMETPVFIQKFAAGMVMQGHPEKALPPIDSALVKHPNLIMLHYMKAGIYAAMQDTVNAIQEYRIAADDEQADVNTLKSASKYFAQYAISQLDAVKGRNREARNKIKKIRETYLKPALSYAQRAAAILPEDPEIVNTIETVTYRLH